MTITLTINGMSCGHCEKHVVNALQALPGVQSAAADSQTGTAVLTCDSAPDDDALRAAIDDAGYALTAVTRP